jgi:hypothetical protein
MAQLNAVEWASHEPDWKIRRFTCAPMGSAI